MAAGSRSRTPKINPLMPDPMAVAIEEVKRDTLMSDGIAVMLSRVNELSGGELAATLIGIAAMPTARRHLDLALDTMWGQRTLGNFPKEYTRDAQRKAQRKPDKAEVKEIVIGAGLHAAIYCATRVLTGHPKPLVLEQSNRVGGAIAVTNSSTFYLNSRNRPGVGGTPGDEFASLNFIPGAPIQPSDISADEYQRNSDLGFIIRVMLAMYAEVWTRCPLEDFARGEATDVNDENNRHWYITLKGLSGRVIKAERVIVATGLGKPIYNPPDDSRHWVSFEQFMKRMDSTPFPMRGITRAAILGGGDGGKVVVEALTGQGPSEHMSMASMDFVRRIDWFDNNNDCATRGEWLESCRPRYAKIAQLLPKTRDESNRIKRMFTSASLVGEGYGAAYVNGVAYDIVVDCRGYDLAGSGSTPAGWTTLSNMGDFAPVPGGRTLAKRYSTDDIFRVGPAAQLARTTGEPSGSENQVAIFRYADRTAQLAAMLS